jgi:hypothetical protein
MSRPLKLQIVERARALIADEQHWCRGQLAEDATRDSVFPTSASAIRRCGLDAVIAAAYQLTKDYDAANQLAHNALRPDYGISTLGMSMTQEAMGLCLHCSTKLSQRSVDFPATSRRGR